MLSLSGMKFLRKLLKREYKTLLSVKIHEDALRHNLNVFRKMCPKQSICPVLKSNAYGHGLVEVGRIMEKESVDFLIVDSLYEAYELEKGGVQTPVLILGYNHPENLRSGLPFHFTVSDFEGIETYANLGVPVHIEVDTGMNRMGFRMENLPKALRKMKEAELNVVGLFTHLADADGPTEDYNNTQLQNFKAAIQMTHDAGFTPQWIHVGNSAGASKSKDIPGVNMVRLGVGLYGTPTLDTPEHNELKPTLEFLTTIVSIRELKKGEKLSYNCTYEAPEDMKIAVLGCGYHEGIPRSLSNRGPFLGRVCMNHCFVRAEDHMQVGDTFPIYSLHGEHSVLELAPHAETITYELLVSLDGSIRRHVC